jgi:hypothetical protein
VQIAQRWLVWALWAKNQDWELPEVMEYLVSGIKAGSLWQTFYTY